MQTQIAWSLRNGCLATYYMTIHILYTLVFGQILLTLLWTLFRKSHHDFPWRIYYLNQMMHISMVWRQLWYFGACSKAVAGDPLFLNRKMSLLLNEHQQLLPTLSLLTTCGCFMIKEWPPHASTVLLLTSLFLYLLHWGNLDTELTMFFHLCVLLVIALDEQVAPCIVDSAISVWTCALMGECWLVL